MIEKAHPDAVWGETLMEMGHHSPWKDLCLTCFPYYWKPSTFGEGGFKVVNAASIQCLICNDIKGCPFTSFSVPRPVPPQTATISASSLTPDRE